MTITLILFIILVVAIFLSSRYELFQNYIEERIGNKPAPPNVYMTDNMEYSPETVMANVNDVRQELQRYQMELPNLVSVYVNNMQQ
jgi:uncharacterized membrane protein